MITNCCPNTLAISRPTTSPSGQVVCNQCPTSTNLGPLDPCQKNLIGPRPNRGKVREQIKDYVLLMLGAPRIKLELDEQQLDLACDQSLKIFEDYAPREYFNYYVFNTNPGQSVYTMPPDIGVVRNVFYKQLPNFTFQSSDLGGAIPVEYFYPGGAYSSIQGGLIDPIQPIWGRMGEWTLYKDYEMMYSRISSSLGGWEWVDNYRTVKLYPTPCKVQGVIVHYLSKNHDFCDIQQAMQELSLAHAMIMLGHIRGKIRNPPGPTGPLQLDYDYMLTKGWELKEKIQNDLISKWGDLPFISLG